MMDREQLIQIQADKLKNTSLGIVQLDIECKKNIFNVTAMMNTVFQIVINFNFITNSAGTFKIQSSYTFLLEWVISTQIHDSKV